MRRLKHHIKSGKRVLLLKLEGDDRFSNTEIVTHDKETMAAHVCATLASMEHLVEEYDIFGFDEGQFWEGLPDFAEDMSRRGKKVIIAALAGTYARTPFPIISQMISIADDIKPLYAICVQCGESAAFTRRITANLDCSPVECFHKSDLGGAEK